jgi:hypothetical protein
LDISAENASELAFHTSFPGGDYPADSSCLSNAVSLSTFAALRLSKLSSFFLLYFLSLQPLGLRDKTLFKHGEFYEIVCDDGRL